MTKDMFIHALWDWRSAIASPYGPEDPVTRHVLLTIALHMNPAGDSAFPTVDRLADETGLSRRTIIRHTAGAAREGWLGKRERQGKSGQGWRRIEYLPLIPEGVEQSVQVWRERERAAWRAQAEKGGDSQSPRRGGDSHDKGGDSDGTKVVPQLWHRNAPSKPPSKAAAARAQASSRPVDNSAAAANGKLLYPNSLSAAQQEAIRGYLETLHPRQAQTLLDELEGILRSGVGGRTVRDPMAMFATLTRQHEEGTFVPSHAHRIQAEREGAR